MGAGAGNAQHGGKINRGAQSFCLLNSAVLPSRKAAEFPKSGTLRYPPSDEGAALRRARGGEFIATREKEEKAMNSKSRLRLGVRSQVPRFPSRCLRSRAQVRHEFCLRTPASG